MDIAKAVQPEQVSGCEQYRPLIEKYDWDVRIMMAVMEVESTHDKISCNSSAVGDDYVINGIHAVSCGLLQVRTLAGRPTCEQLKDPATNIETAYKIFKSQGYKAWSMYTNQKYLNYLK